jgi:hypothetical protein
VAVDRHGGSGRGVHADRAGLHHVRSGTWGGQVARQDREFQPHRAAGQFAEGGLDAVAVLGADPVQLETVGHAQAHHHVTALLGDIGGREGSDPGIELLLRQFRGKAFAAPLP